MSSIEKLLDIMARLRDEELGCPWDCEQTFATIAPYTVEEAYEVADAIAREDLTGLRGELGDLLFQVVFHARMAEEQDAFDFDDVVESICAKLRRRHPHVFGSPEERAAGPEPGSWERIKAEERAAEGGGSGSTLDGIATALPALKRASQLGTRAAACGFDWPDACGVADKIAEEAGELATARHKASDAEIAEEFGDLLFALVNLSRHLGVDAEQALSDANRKFERRFRHMESALAGDGKPLDTLGIDELEAAWQAAKQALAGD